MLQDYTDNILENILMGTKAVQKSKNKYYNFFKKNLHVYLEKSQAMMQCAVL